MKYCAVNNSKLFHHLFTGNCTLLQPSTVGRTQLQLSTSESTLCHQLSTPDIDSIILQLSTADSTLLDLLLKSSYLINYQLLVTLSSAVYC